MGSPLSSAALVATLLSRGCALGLWRYPNEALDSSANFLVAIHKYDALSAYPIEPQLFGFHFSLPMGYAESVPYFCMATKTVAEMSNASLGYRHRSKVHPLESNVAKRASADSGEPM